ncbi:hypothetical protein EJA72_13170 [Pseudomonas sp. PB120]|nr:hypothetical protein [Pseudomonas sp. PB120]
MLGRRNSTCGSEPARDGVVSVDINVECQSAIASRLAPTGISIQFNSIQFNSIESKHKKSGHRVNGCHLFKQLDYSP